MKRTVAALVVLASFLAVAPVWASNPWPTRARYIQVMSNLEKYLADRSLRGATVKLDQRRIPISYSGSFSTVFPVRTRGNHRIALRVFHPLEESDERHDFDDFKARYDKLKGYIAGQRKKGAYFPEIIDFMFVRNGLQIDGQVVPIMKMPFLVSRGLDEFVERRLQQGRANKIGDIAFDFRQSMKAFSRAKLAHGDLHPGNVQVEIETGRLRFMDYDSMYAPPLAGMENSEIGSVNFQHPKFFFDAAGKVSRTRRPFDEKMDHFSAAVIYTSLLAIQADPSLWAKYHSDEDTMLIFTGQRDFVDPKRSPVFADLKKSPDQKVRKLAAKLERYCSMDPSRIPDLERTIEQATRPYYAQQGPQTGGSGGSAGGGPAPARRRRVVMPPPANVAQSPAPSAAAPAAAATRKRPGWYAQGSP